VWASTPGELIELVRRRKLDLRRFSVEKLVTQRVGLVTKIWVEIHKLRKGRVGVNEWGLARFGRMEGGGVRRRKPT